VEETNLMQPENYDMQKQIRINQLELLVSEMKALQEENENLICELKNQINQASSTAHPLSLPSIMTMQSNEMAQSLRKGKLLFICSQTRQNFTFSFILLCV
jgi:hypothetical protein